MRLVRKVETIVRFRPMTDEQVSEVTGALWDMAVEIEDGDLEDARARMERARDRLQEAMRNGASDEEIARLMQELRDATQDYMRQMAQQQARDRANDPNQPPMDMENAMRMTQDDIQRMMDRIQELMEEGRMAEAQQALEELQQMLENMQMTEGQGGGEGQQSPGEQAMEGLGETLRDQQELSDQAFRDLQDQFNPDGNSGQRGQQGQQGEDQGQQAAGWPGTTAGPATRPEPGRRRWFSPRDNSRARRAKAPPMPGILPTVSGNCARNWTASAAICPAPGPKRDARRATRSTGPTRRCAAPKRLWVRATWLRPIDQQSQAMDALREGMRNLGEAMSQQERDLGRSAGRSRGGQPRATQ